MIDIDVAETDIVSESLMLDGFGNDTVNLGGGANLTATYNGVMYGGGGGEVFDFGLSVAQTNVSSTPFTFQIASTLLSLDKFETAGLRFQSTGPRGENSSKQISGLAPLAPVPLPAAGILLLAAVGGLGIVRRRRQAA